MTRTKIQVGNYIGNKMSEYLHSEYTYIIPIIVLYTFRHSLLGTVYWMLMPTRLTSIIIIYHMNFSERNIQYFMYPCSKFCLILKITPKKFKIQYVVSLPYFSIFVSCFKTQHIILFKKQMLCQSDF